MHIFLANIPCLSKDFGLFAIEAHAFLETVTVGDTLVYIGLARVVLVCERVERFENLIDGGDPIVDRI